MVPKFSILGINVELYGFFNFFGWVLCVLYNLSQMKRKEKFLSPISAMIIEKGKEKKHKWAKYCLFCETLALASAQFFVGLPFLDLWGRLITNGAGNYFGFIFYAPIIFIIICALLRVPPLKQLDLSAPAYAISLVSFKIACFCAGCCNGVEWEHGLYNFFNGRIEFPIQLLECLVAIVIFTIIHFYSKKNRKEGTVFPLYLILYCVTRFCTEFLRDDFPKIVGPLTTYHFQCLVGLIVGIAEMWFVVVVAKKIKWLNLGFSYKGKGSQ